MQSSTNQLGSNRFSEKWNNKVKKFHLTLFEKNTFILLSLLFWWCKICKTLKKHLQEIQYHVFLFSVIRSFIIRVSELSINCSSELQCLGVLDMRWLNEATPLFWFFSSISLSWSELWPLGMSHYLKNISSTTQKTQWFPLLVSVNFHTSKPGATSITSIWYFDPILF